MAIDESWFGEYLEAMEVAEVVYYGRKLLVWRYNWVGIVIIN